MKNISKTGIFLLILMLAIGFAAFSVTLYINGSVSVVNDEADFNVYFSRAEASDGSTASISSDNKTITFVGKDLSIPGETVKLDYTVVNDSSLYDADVSLDISVEDGANGDRSSYYTINTTGFNLNESQLISAKTTYDGSLEIYLNKSYAGGGRFDLIITVTLNVEAQSRTEVEPGIETISGTIYDNHKQPLANATLMMLSTPTVFTTDANGHYEVNIEKGEHSIYYIPGYTREQYEAAGESIKDNTSAYFASINTYISTDMMLISEKIGDIIEYSLNDLTEQFIYLGDDENHNMILFAKKTLYCQNNLCAQNSENTSCFSYMDDGGACNYETSNVKSEVDSYVNALRTSNGNVNIISGRLLTNAEYESLIGLHSDSEKWNYEEEDYREDHGFVYDYEYWLSDCINTETTSGIVGNAYFSYGQYRELTDTESYYSGIRPVIVVGRS